MAQLDKTFPTNDCSTCILSPKFIECAVRSMLRKEIEIVEVDANMESPAFAYVLVECALELFRP